MSVTEQHKGRSTTTITRNAAGLPGTLIALSESIAALIAEHGGNAEIEFTAEDENGDPAAVNYEITRPATQEEVNEKIASEKAQAKYHMEQRRKEFEKLRAEFEPKDAM